MYDLKEEAHCLERTAEWRRRKADDFPDDKRNLEAATFLENLAEGLRGLEGSSRHRKFAEYYASCDPYGFTERQLEYQRQIGFWEFPTPEAYLDKLSQS